MTAVEFLLSHMWTSDWVNYTRDEKLEVIEKAKQMEADQMKDQRLEGYKEGIDSASTYCSD